ncbi:MAG: tRNA (guanosine(37)-N1)-methyltransferase TrmD [Saprospiraceae bacterium]|nr:tRNA (guanosine(37)-N1)-methyltransferase TrmD [Saprospiraceae bacterium]
MRCDILAVIPELLEGPFQHSILKRAQQKGLMEVHVHDLRDWGQGKHRQIDDYQYGGGAGMVLMVEPLWRAITDLQQKTTYDEIIYLTPDGKTLNQSMANALSLRGNLLLVCGHYKGIDERIREHLITMEISIGDYVLSGGELAAAVLVDALGRLIPGVLNNETSALEDSFQDDLLSHPVYTRPEEFNGWEVPAVLMSGHERKIREWREDQALARTQARRPDLLSS